jgi:hypothetical protein
MTTLVEVINRIQALCRSLDGMRNAPNVPPEQIDRFPFSVCYPHTGVISRDGIWLNEEHTLMLEIHAARVDLPRDVSSILPYLRWVAEAVFGDRDLFDGQGFTRQISYLFGPLDWAHQRTLGWQFSIPISMTADLSNPQYPPAHTTNPDIEDLVGQIQTIARQVAGVRAAPNLPPEDLNQFPFLVTYPQQGRLGYTPQGWYQDFHTVVTEAHVARRELPRDAEAAYPFARSIPDALFNEVSLSSSASSLNRIRYTFGGLGWGSDGEPNTLGFRFYSEIKVNLS